MLIDWFTVFAQLVNFLILMALLKHFLFKPIMGALADREKKIAGQLEEARKIEADAERERNEYVHKNELFEQQRAKLLKQVQNEANHEREKLTEAARAESAELRASWQQALEIEQSSLHRDIMRKTREEVFAITRKTLEDLASDSLEQRIAEVFIARLKTLPGPEKDLLNQAVLASSKPVLVRSAFTMAPKQQHELKQVLHAVFGGDFDIEFELDPDQISGIELSTHGHKLSWNIADYLASMEHSIDALLDVKTTVSTDRTGNDRYAAG